MTEAEWITCVDLQKLLEYMTGRATDRKFRLFATACCRRVWHLLDVRCQAAVEVAERCADGAATEDEVEAALRAVTVSWNETVFASGTPAKHSWASSAARMALFDTPFWKPSKAEQWAYGTAWQAAEAAWRHEGGGGPAAETGHQLALLRDVFENPYRPGWVDPDAVTPAVLSLARQMYESRDFVSTAALADALEDAGCAHPDLIGHCRGGGPHVRGCWAVDLVLGKE